MLGQAPVLLLAAATVLSLALVTLPLLAVPQGVASSRVALRRYRLSYALMLVLCSVLMLSGCGTAPLQAATCPPVPAELLASPQAPVLLQPATRLKTPGPTSPPTPPVAAPTGASTSV
jgi:hypothetical protein